MKSLLLLAAVLLHPLISDAQIKNATTGTVKIYGNCAICEKTIEKAGYKKKLYKTDWDMDSKIATITYNRDKTGLDAVLKKIALAGFDNTIYLAPDDTYAKLPVCCKYSREKKAIVKTKNEPPVINETAFIPDKTPNEPDKQNDKISEPNQLKPVFDNYFALKDALVKTDVKTASSKATALYESLIAVKMENLKMDEHEAWMKLEKNLKADAGKIKESKDVSGQRENFMTLSDNMYHLIKASNVPGTIYYQHCPMANDGKGANWLSKESAIRNPYYGSQMLSCGNIAETIK